MAVNLGARSQIILQLVRNSTKRNINSCEQCCRIFGTHAASFQRRKRVQDQSNAEFMTDEIKKYEMGKRWLAKMMGVDVETFTDSDVEESLKYLLPTKLFAKDARPLMKHPSKLFPESKSMLSSDGRPIHSAFYTGATAFNDLIYEIFRFSRSTQQTEESECIETQAEEDSVSEEVANQTFTKQEKFRWLHQNELQLVLKEELTLKDYDVIIHRLKKLASENKNKQSEDIKIFLEKFQTSVKQEGSQFAIQELDENGRAHGKGYRKRAMAEVWISKGNGDIIINDIPIIEYFPKQEDRNQVWHPLITLDRIEKFDVECNVIGGGTTGQAGAIRLAISRALTTLSSDFLPRLQTAGLLTRDGRLVERKKPGQKKARKKFAWVKR